MAINVTVTTPKFKAVKFSTNTSPIILRSGVVGGGAGATALAQLTDVNLANTANGNVLVYNNTNSTFVLGGIDGGEF
jgi:hypothetical protein